MCPHGTGEWDTSECGTHPEESIETCNISAELGEVGGETEALLIGEEVHQSAGIHTWTQTGTTMHRVKYMHACMRACMFVCTYVLISPGSNVTCNLLTGLSSPRRRSCRCRASNRNSVSRQVNASPGDRVVQVQYVQGCT